MVDYDLLLNIFYDESCGQTSDINEHVPTLKKYAEECKSVVEFGVRGGVSTIGLLKGLRNNQMKDSSYIGVDLVKYKQVDAMRDLCRYLEISYEFREEDSSKVDIPESDLLFIDTWHVYGHLKRELANNHHKIRKYIIMHDTTVDEKYGESIRCNMNIMEQHQRSGYPVEEIVKGLWPAITEFLQDHPEWTIKERFYNNNGLTILERK